MADRIQTAQSTLEALVQGGRLQAGQVTLEVLQQPGTTQTAQVTSERLAYGTRQAVAAVSLELLWQGTDVPRPQCEPLPAWIAYGATGGPEWGTALFAAPGGWEQRTQLFAQVRGRWDVSFVNVSKEQATTVVDFFRAVACGRAGAFCFTDWRDHTLSNVIGMGDGVLREFQLVKVYTSGTLSYTRPLTRPVADSLVVTLNGVLTEAYTVDTMGGTVTFTTPPPAGTQIHVTGEFEVLVRFESDQLMVTCVAPNVFSCAGLGLVELIGE
jgi:uncharacterized protein (TIGR02217 family)